MMTMSLGHRIALWVVTGLVALMMGVVGPGVSVASADSANNGSPKHSSSGDDHCDKDKKHDNNSKNKKDKGGGGGSGGGPGGFGNGGGGGSNPGPV